MYLEIYKTVDSFLKYETQISVTCFVFYLVNLASNPCKGNWIKTKFVYGHLTKPIFMLYIQKAFNSLSSVKILRIIQSASIIYESYSNLSLRLTNFCGRSLKSQSRRGASRTNSIADPSSVRIQIRSSQSLLAIRRLLLIILSAFFMIVFFKVVFWNNNELRCR